MTPYEILDIPSGSTPEQVKAAYRKLAMRYHPDRNPGDVAAAARMAEINMAYEAITKGRSFDPFDLFVITILEAIAGSGKTRETCRQLARQARARTVIAAPTIDLIGEIETWLKEFGCVVPVTAIHSGPQSSRTVGTRIERWFEDLAQQSDPDGILLCSHAAVLDLEIPALAGGFDLVFDEVPDVFRFDVRQLPRRHWLITRYLDAQPYMHGVLLLQPGSRKGDESDRLAVIAKNSWPDEVDALFADLAAAVLDPHRLVLVLESQWRELVQPKCGQNFGGELDVLTILHPERFRRWRSVSIMGARASQTMTHLLWSRVFHQRFKEHLDQGRFQSLHTNGGQLTVRWFFEDRATRSMLGQQSTAGVTMQMAMCDSVAQFFGDQEFLWTLPQPKEGGGVKDRFWRGRGPAFKPALRLSGKSLGQNAYREHTRLALLSVINFSPGQYELLDRLGLSPDEVTEAHAFITLYQDLMRSLMRMLETSQPVICIVPCLPSAQSLAAHFPGCQIDQMPAHLLPQRAGQQKRGPKRKGSTMSGAERQRRRRARMRSEREQARQREKEDA